MGAGLNSFLFKTSVGVLLALISVSLAYAQSSPLQFSTVERAPFATVQNGELQGFSIDLMREIAQKLDRSVSFKLEPGFPDMLANVGAGAVDGAIANISITAAREEMIDFSQPIFESGLKILVPGKGQENSVFDALLTRDILLAGLIAIGALFGAGMLMWVFERRRQPYFDRPAKQALFPAFWWALNLVVNGGFEERQPQSAFGRAFATMMVIASLFLVSIFVAHVTAVTTIDALQENVSTLNDLDGQTIGTVRGSTSADLLEARDLFYSGYENPVDLFNALVAGKLDAIVFDAPILAYLASQAEPGSVRLLERNYRPENYGIALPENSTLREPINRALLSLREDGSYDDLVTKWFGNNYRP